MSVRMDDAIRENRTRFTTQTSEKSSGPKWVLIVAVGVFLGVTASTFSIRLFDNALMRYELNELNKKLAVEQSELRERLKEQNKINAARLQRQKIENEKRQAGYRQAMETCNFWRDQYAKSQTSSNKYQRDQSCDFVNQFR